MNYDEGAIRRVGEDTIERILLNNETVKIGSTNENETIKMFALENYIIKYYSNPKSPELKRAIEAKLDSLLNAFVNNPTLINYSAILSNLNIARVVFSNKGNIYKSAIDKLKVGLDDIYNKLMNDEQVPEADKDRLMTYFSLMLTFKKDKTPTQKAENEKIEKYMKKVMKKNVIPTNKLERLLIFNYASRYVFAQEGYPNEKRHIRIVEMPGKNGGFTGGYQYYDFIAMNSLQCSKPDFYHRLDQMVQTIMHETTHAIQEIKAKEDSKSVHAMEMAIQKLFGFGEYQTGDNYLFNEIEEDAQRKGYWYAGVMYQGIDPKISDQLLKEKMAYLEDRRFQYEYVTITNPDGSLKKVSKESFNVENIRRVVRNNPSLINDYPVLNNLFKTSGTPKNLDEMLSEDFISHDITNMYQDFIIQDFRRGDLSTIDMSSKTPKQKYNILAKLNDILKTKVGYVLDSIREYDYRVANNSNTNKSTFLIGHHVQDIETLASFIEQELPFMREFEKNNPGNYSTYSAYQMSIRNLLNGIEAGARENKLANLEPIFDAKKTELGQHDTKLKQEYMNYILDHFTNEEKNTIINTSGKDITLREFVTTEVFDHMDRDHFLHKNNGSIICNPNGVAITPVEFVRNVLNKNLQKNVGEGPTGETPQGRKM